MKRRLPSTQPGSSRVLRTGFTLIEMTLVISLLALLLGSFASVFALSWKARSEATSHRESVGAILRLADQFRDDVHAASSISVAPQAGGQRPAQLTATFAPGREVVYEVHHDRIARRFLDGGQVVRREAFFLPPAIATRWEIDSTGPLTLATLHLTPGDNEHGQKLPLPPVAVEAVVGLQAGHAAPGDAP